jgi:hypothetical protein
VLVLSQHKPDAELRRRYCVRLHQPQKPFPFLHFHMPTFHTNLLKLLHWGLFRYGVEAMVMAPSSLTLSSTSGIHGPGGTRLGATATPSSTPVWNNTLYCDMCLVLTDLCNLANNSHRERHVFVTISTCEPLLTQMSWLV